MKTKYVTSLKLSQELDKLGLKGESENFWTNGFYMEHLGWLEIGSKLKLAKEKNNFGRRYSKMISPKKSKYVLNFGSPNDQDRYGKPDSKIKWYRAYHCEELAEVLPHPIVYGKTATQYACGLRLGWENKYFGLNTRDLWNISQADTLAEAMGLMVVWLIKNGHLKVEDINRGKG